MRKIRIFSIILFLIAVAVYGGYKKYVDETTDSTRPVISMEEDSITVSIEDPEEAILEGIIAVDKKDGDVSSSLIIESISNFVGENQRTATIVAFDSDNHVTRVTRDVIYSDYYATRFSLSAPLKFPTGTSDFLEYLSAEDALDGDVTSQIKTSSAESINESDAGEYSIEFSVTNSAGDVSTLPVTVEFYDTAEENKKPQIELSKYLIYTDEELDLWKYIESITMNNLEYTRSDDDDDVVFQLSDDVTVSDDTWTSIYKNDITINEDIDYTEPGTYEVLYEVEDEDGDVGSIRLIVVVE